MKYKYYVEGMTCAACVSAVESAVANLPGVESVSVNLVTTELVINGENISESELYEAIYKAGYKITKEKQKVNKNGNKKLIIAIIISVLLMYVSMGEMFGIPLIGFLKDKFINAIIQMVLSLSIIIMYFKYYKVGFRRLFKLKPNMDSLVSVGSCASFVYGVVSIIFIFIGMKTNNEEMIKNYSNLYFDSASMILVLVSIGKTIEGKSKLKTMDSITKLMKLAPQETIIKINNEEKVIMTKDVKVGDIVVCKQGMSVSVDGKIVNGAGSFDESSITGESVPVYKTQKDKVVSSSMLLNGYVEYEATKVGDDTTINTIIRLVNEASNSKAPISRFVDKVAGKFTFVVISIALIAFTIFMILEGSFEFALNIFISVLVVSCPCALGLATPIAIMVGTGVCARNGILIKEAEVFEVLSELKTIVFDKTGTLTNGKPVVTDYTSKEVLEIAYNIERLSSHPLAHAITEKAHELKLEMREVKNFNSIPGQGVAGSIDGITYYFGNLQMLKDLFILDNLEKTEIEKLELEFIDNSKVGTSVLALADDKKVIGLIKLRDEIKETTLEVVNELHQNGVEVVMLTGDKAETAEYISKKLGIDRYYAEVLPQDKQTIIKEIMIGGTTAMVGDGVNDAIALTEADIGIAIGGGTDIAIDSSDVVLLHNDLYGVTNVISLSKRVMKNIKINLFWAFFYNVIGIALAAGVLYYVNGILLNPMICALAMSFSSVFVCTNALTINLFKGKEVKKMKKLIVPSMACMHCVKRIDEVLKKVKGLKKYNIVLEEKSVTLDTDSEKVINKAIAELKKAGYECE